VTSVASRIREVYLRVESPLPDAKKPAS
jgi:hypothetical protein